MAGAAVVLGAGVAGLATAIGLRQAGWDVEVRERARRVNGAGAAFGLWPAAQRGLERLGLADDLARVAVPYRSASVRSSTGRRLGSLPLGRIERAEGRPVVLVARPVLMDLLLERLTDLGTQPLLDAAPLSEPGLSGQDLVVAAAGIGSSTRRVVDPRSGPPRPLGATAWRGTCDGEVDEHGEVWGRGMFAGVTPSSAGRTNWYVAVSDALGIDSLPALHEAVASWPSPVPHVLARTDEAEVLHHPLHDLAPPRRFARGTVVLVGDAAHAMAPSLGQGACQAVLDATELVEQLAVHADVPSGLAAYDRARRREVTRVVRGSRLLLRARLSRAGAPARDTVLRVLAPLTT
jgi:2-polyprenyl-6-methoxyphenol hydroxylase-like FAD-dependent oxidoreductase